MKWIILVSIFIIIFIAIARAQSFTHAIRIYPDRIIFDWPAVNACAMTGDVTCRIAMAARNGS